MAMVLDIWRHRCPHLEVGGSERCLKVGILYRAGLDPDFGGEIARDDNKGRQRCRISHGFFFNHLHILVIIDPGQGGIPSGRGEPLPGG